MTININKINQSNNFNTRLTKPKVGRVYSAIQKKYTIQGTGDMGKFIPIHYEEMIPGQKISLQQEVGIQFMPFVTNLLHEIEGEILTYFVPYRILWDKWEDFMVGGDNGENTDHLPYIMITDLFRRDDVYPIEGRGYPLTADNPKLEGSLWDKFGMPITPHHEYDSPEYTEDDRALAFIFMAYNMIWNENIRIPDLEEERSWEIEEGGKVKKMRMDLAPCHWSWDYFTRARIYQQRGVIPTVPVQDVEGELMHEFQYGYWTGRPENDSMKWNQENGSGIFSGNTVGYNNGSPISPVADEYITIFGKQAEDTLRNANIEHGQGNSVNIRLMPHNLSGLGIDLNDFLTALGIMRVQVNNAKIESRYADHLRVRWGVYPEDARLQMPEYIGMKSFNVNVDTVTNTAEKQGDITGQAWGSYAGGEKQEYEAKEHGIIISIMAIRPKTSYEQGLPRIVFADKTRFDFPTPELANLPDVQIQSREIAYTGNKETDVKGFGWTGIYEEYRTNINIVTGKLRPSIKDGLHSYTLARYWKNPPQLNKDFIQCNPDKYRIMMYPEEPTFIYFVRNETREAIPLPIQSEPAMLGTF